MQSHCEAWAPQSTYRPLYSAIVCGTSISTLAIKKQWMVTGLIHVLVVSGSHFLTLQQILKLGVKRMPILSAIIPTTLFIYLFLTGFQPPGARAVAQIFLTSLANKLGFAWKGPLIQVLTCLALLSLCPIWWQSASFWLSCMCGLAISLTPAQWVFRKQLWVFFLLHVMISELSTQNLISLLSNLAIAPVLSFLLFPLSLGSFFIPSLTWLVDALWSFTLFIVQNISSLAEVEIYKLPMKSWSFYVLSTLLGVYFLQMLIRRQKCIDA